MYKNAAKCSSGGLHQQNYQGTHKLKGRGRNEMQNRNQQIHKKKETRTEGR